MNQHAEHMGQAHPVDGQQICLEQRGRYLTNVFVSPHNRRVRVLDYRALDPGAMARALVELARVREVTKVFCKTWPADVEGLAAEGFEHEATVKGYFSGQDAMVMSSFLSETRRQSSASEEELRFLDALVCSPVPSSDLQLPRGYSAAFARPKDATELGLLYREVFGSYPFPIFDPGYLRAVMASHVLFSIVRDGAGKLVAAASAEMDIARRSAEMTDFATLPQERGKHLAMYLLQELEREMDNRGIPNLYTLARSGARGMNKVFHHLGYRYTGRLVQNCYIAGQLEDMLCWCKQLQLH